MTNETYEKYLIEEGKGGSLDAVILRYINRLQAGKRSEADTSKLMFLTGLELILYAALSSDNESQKTKYFNHARRGI